jgi:hypothetical protein
VHAVATFISKMVAILGRDLFKYHKIDQLDNGESQPPQDLAQSPPHTRRFFVRGNGLPIWIVIIFSLTVLCSVWLVNLRQPDLDVVCTNHISQYCRSLSLKLQTSMTDSLSTCYQRCWDSLRYAKIQRVSAEDEYLPERRESCRGRRMGLFRRQLYTGRLFRYTYVVLTV